MLILGFALPTLAQRLKYLEQTDSALTVDLTIELMTLEKLLEK
jgi:hypothetical protein